MALQRGQGVLNLAGVAGQVEVDAEVGEGVLETVQDLRDVIDHVLGLADDQRRHGSDQPENGQDQAQHDNNGGDPSLEPMADEPVHGRCHGEVQERGDHGPPEQIANVPQQTQRCPGRQHQPDRDSEGLRAPRGARFAHGGGQGLAQGTWFQARRRLLIGHASESSALRAAGPYLRPTPTRRVCPRSGRRQAPVLRRPDGPTRSEVVTASPSRPPSW